MQSGWRGVNRDNSSLEDEGVLAYKTKSAVKCCSFQKEHLIQNKLMQLNYYL